MTAGLWKVVQQPRGWWARTLMAYVRVLCIALTEAECLRDDCPGHAAVWATHTVIKRSKSARNEVGEFQRRKTDF